MTMRVITDLESLPSLKLAAAESPIIPVYRAFGHSNRQKPHRELASPCPGGLRALLAGGS
jgi:hypothetical protein